MRKLYILKIGTTFPATAKRLGDFDAWTEAALGPVAVETSVLDVEHGTTLPAAAHCAGVVVTGSHAMVTDELPWSVKLEAWLPSLLTARVPFFGVCYGHQLLARAAGGEVGFHPGGKEIGTVVVERLPDSDDDELFHMLPRSFLAHVSHSQTVRRLPPGARRLAANAHEPTHAFRLGDCAWGVQFHPEYSADIARSYVEEQGAALEAAGLDALALARGIRETPTAGRTLRSFARLVERRVAAGEA